jgi:hypothetical protein
MPLSGQLSASGGTQMPARVCLGAARGSVRRAYRVTLFGPLRSSYGSNLGDDLDMWSRAFLSFVSSF